MLGQPASTERRLSTPSELYPRLFEMLERSCGGFDKKLVADADPRVSPQVVEAAVEQLSGNDSAQLAAILPQWFNFPNEDRLAITSGDLRLEREIHRLWDQLVRSDEQPPDSPSLIRLPYPYVVPGGMFRESYYWDCYFTLLGLRDRPTLARGTVDNLAFLIDRFGFVPNGNRTYYLSRSQPPLFYAASTLSGIGDAAQCWAHYLPRLVAEHAFWMSGAESLPPGDAAARVVRMADGALLNRYWDDIALPRDESRAGRDAAVAARASRPAEEVFRNIRGACESGWDFSSRWLGDRRAFETIRTTSIIPCDLNAFLFGLEAAIAKGASRRGESSLACSFSEKACSRRQAMTKWLWNEQLGLFDDFDRETGLRGAITCAALAPLFTGSATPEQARRTEQRVRSDLLSAGGLLATEIETGEQWDAPNGWAPLHWIAVEGLERYGRTGLAREIAGRWLITVNRVFRATGRLVEKYDVANVDAGGGGEYALQEGFGWTNGVTLAMLERYPDLYPDGYLREASFWSAIRRAFVRNLDTVRTSNKAGDGEWSAGGERKRLGLDDRD